jgi:hypothetical protein
MIERRRLFFRSDFLRDITHPALFPELVCSLHVHYQETMESRLPKQNCDPTAGTRPVSDANWPYRNSLTGSCALSHIRVFDLLCLSNQLGLV